MSKKELLPQSLILENRIGIRRGIFLTVLLFLFIFLPWLISQRELFRQEGVFAAIAAEFFEGADFAANGANASAHHQLLRDAWPLYPAVVSFFHRFMPMEMALRFISAFMLGILSLIAGKAAAARCGSRAGIVSALCCFGTLFALDKGVNGGPESMAACFLLSAQLLFYHYGYSRGDWNSAWISSAVLLALGFFTAGPAVILFFIFPLIFMRRPLSYSGKFRIPGFFAGVILLAVSVIGWLLPLGLDWRHYAYSSGVEIMPFSEYIIDVIAFPFVFAVRMMPWCLVMWLPFCVALQAVSPQAVFSRYHRTLFFSMLALVWLIPGASSLLIFFLIGPLAILTGMYYELGVRRYGRSLRRGLAFGGLAFPLMMLLVLMILFLPEKYIAIFGDAEKMSFRAAPEYFYLAVGAVILLAVLAMFFCYSRKRLPVWTQIMLICFGISIIGTVEMLPYRLMEKDWRKFGSDVRNVLPPDAEKLYKYEIDGMYCGLFYTGVPVYTLEQLEKLDSLEDTVYLISASAPVYPDREWTPLLPEGYKCRGVEVSVWKGERPLEDEGLDE
ncbi:MAG: hypothetical protein E7051_04365 [Lentisphaerae bacterium]|nr:hypothetical protein [Lentisphaerota bacterium]